MLTGLTQEPKGPEESDTSKLLDGKGMVHQAYFGAISKMGKLETRTWLLGGKSYGGLCQVCSDCEMSGWNCV